MSSVSYSVIAIILAAIPAIYYAIQLISHSRETFLPESFGKKHAIETLKVISSKVNKFYETLQPSFRLGDRNEVRIMAVPIILILTTLTFFVGRLVNFSSFFTIVFSYIQYYVFWALFPIYINWQISRFFQSPINTIKTEEDSLGLVRKANSLVWEVENVALAAVALVIIIEAFLIASLGEMFDLGLVVAIIEIMSTIFTASTLIRKYKTALEFELSKIYFLHLEKAVELSIIIAYASERTNEYSGMLVALGDGIYLKRDDGFTQKIPWRIIVSLAARE
ncbi:MAG: hypothetical protein JRN10_00745 [Nitrososphaerota archaeon]|nr:hypothetical protein [Nitrososphaerota archaeon]MDG6929764.1 hypothetical protein [Nitrososphaerota archaeon]